MEVGVLGDVAKEVKHLNRPIPVIASEAKQSSAGAACGLIKYGRAVGAVHGENKPKHRGEMDCFASLAMTAETMDRSFCLVSLG